MISSDNPVPPPKCTPNHVRDYLVRLLILNYDLRVDSAVEVARRWKLGRGSHLHRYPKDTYLRIFGREAVPFIYESVQADIRAEWYASVTGRVNSGKSEPTLVGFWDEYSKGRTLAYYFWSGDLLFLSSVYRAYW